LRLELDTGHRIKLDRNEIENWVGVPRHFHFSFLSNLILTFIIYFCLKRMTQRFVLEPMLVVEDATADSTNQTINELAPRLQFKDHPPYYRAIKEIEDPVILPDLLWNIVYPYLVEPCEPPKWVTDCGISYISGGQYNWYNRDKCREQLRETV
jgi:hypothetical protein